MGVLSKLLNALGPFFGISTPDSLATTGDTGKNLPPRPPRIQIQSLGGIYFRCHKPEVSQPVGIVNLSTDGIGLLRGSFPEQPEHLDSGKILHGEIVLGNQSYPVVLEIAHVSSQVIGCAFDTDVTQLQLVVHKYFELELAGLSLSQAKSNLLQEQPDGVPHWFKGKNNCELYYVEKDGQVVRFHISFFGNYIEGDTHRALRYGYVVEDENTEKPSYKGSSLVHYVPRLSTDVVDATIRFVTNIEGLNYTHRKNIIDTLQVRDGSSRS